MPDSQNETEDAENLKKDDPKSAKSNNGASGLLQSTPATILATALGTVLILACAAFLVPGLNSMKIQLFQATVEIENSEDAFEVLKGLKENETTRPMLAAWLDQEGYVPLVESTDEELKEEEREARAVKQAAKFRTLVPAEAIGLQLTPEEIAERIRSFEEKTGRTTLAGQLRILAREGDPPFNIIGVSSIASRPGYHRDHPPRGTIYVRQDAEFAKYLADGDAVEIANPQIVPARVMIARVAKRDITSETDLHLAPKQWSDLDLQSVADRATGTASVILIPKDIRGNPSGSSTEVASSSVGPSLSGTAQN